MLPVRTRHQETTDLADTTVGHYRTRSEHSIPQPRIRRKRQTRVPVITRNPPLRAMRLPRIRGERPLLRQIRRNLALHPAHAVSPPGQQTHTFIFTSSSLATAVSNQDPFCWRLEEWITPRILHLSRIHHGLTLFAYLIPFYLTVC